MNSKRCSAVSRIVKGWGVQKQNLEKGKVGSALGYHPGDKPEESPPVRPRGTGGTGHVLTF